MQSLGYGAGQILGFRAVHVLGYQVVPFLGYCVEHSLGFPPAGMPPSLATYPTYLSSFMSSIYVLGTMAYPNGMEVVSAC